jgi:uncharacterized paraquat-inducible protein A
LRTEAPRFAESRAAGVLLWAMLAAAVILLYEAWTHALLTVKVTAELPALTFTVLDETRSVVTMVGRLVETNYMTIAALIVIFGMVLPVAKNLGVALLLAFSRPGEGGGAWARALQFAGRFAMVDIFAIGIIVSVMAAGTIGAAGQQGGLAKVSTVADLKLGFYLFIAYVVLTFAIDVLLALRYPRAMTRPR